MKYLGYIGCVTTMKDILAELSAGTTGIADGQKPDERE